MRKNAGILAGCLMVACTAQAEGLYRWVDSEGRVHYGERPAPDAAQVQMKKFVVPQAVPDEELLPYASRIAKQNFPVTLYVGKSCDDYCEQGRSLLNKRGIPFVEKYLSTQAEFDELKKNSGSNMIPTLAVGRSFLKGFSARQWNTELDIAGYPTTAPFGVHPVPPAKPLLPASAPETSPEVPQP